MEIATPPRIPALVTSNLLILVATKVLFPAVSATIQTKRRIVSTSSESRISFGPGMMIPKREHRNKPRIFRKTMLDFSEKQAKIRENVQKIQDLYRKSRELSDLRIQGHGRIYNATRPRKIQRTLS
jgi:hypothetical protein